MLTRDNPQIVVLAVAEDELTRLGLRLLLRNVPAVRGLVEATGRADAARRAESAAYDVAVVDATPLAQPDVHALLDDLAAARPDAPLVVYTDDAADVEEHCGRRGLSCTCLSRGAASGRQLFRIIGRLVPPYITGESGGESLAGQAADLVASLTDREREILSLVAAGGASKEIAASLSVSRRTVEFHRARIGAKLGVRTVAGLTKVAVKAGLTSLHDEPCGDAMS